MHAHAFIHDSLDVQYSHVSIASLAGDRGNNQHSPREQHLKWECIRCQKAYFIQGVIP